MFLSFIISAVFTHGSSQYKSLTTLQLYLLQTTSCQTHDGPQQLINAWNMKNMLAWAIYWLLLLEVFLPHINNNYIIKLLHISTRRSESLPIRGVINATSVFFLRCGALTRLSICLTSMWLMTQVALTDDTERAEGATVWTLKRNTTTPSMSKTNV